MQTWVFGGMFSTTGMGFVEIITKAKKWSTSCRQAFRAIALSQSFRGSETFASNPLDHGEYRLRLFSLLYNWKVALDLFSVAATGALYWDIVVPDKNHSKVRG